MSSNSLPKTYKACVIDKPGADWTIQEVPLEQPKEGELCVRVSHSGICGSDDHIQKGHFGPIDKLVCGHEYIGKVVALGKGSEGRWKIGDVVGGAWHGGHCGMCKPCNRGLFQMCVKEQINGVTRNGGHAEYAFLRSEAAVRIPEGIDLAEAAPLMCAGVTVFNGIRQQKLMPGDIVAVQGLGGLGHLAVSFARKMGYHTIAISSSADKKDFAMKLGAHDYIDTSKEDATEALQKLGGADLIVSTAPDPKLVGPLVGALGPLGKLLVLAPVGEVSINTVPMIGKGLSVKSWPSGHALDCEETIAFAKLHDIHCMVEKFPFSQVKEAVDKMITNKVRFRSVLVMDE